MKQSQNRSLLAGACVLLCLAFGVSLCVGRYPLNPRLLLEGEEMAWRVFLTLRLPRTVAAAVGGFGLAIAGSVYQTVFKNPLAAPDVIGVSSGASAGAAAAILFWGGRAFVTTLSAFAGGLLAVGLALLLAGRARQRRLATFVLSGIAVNALAQAALMLLKLLADPQRQLAAIEYWTMGSLAGITAAKLPFFCILVALGAAGLFLLQRQIQLLSLDADEARMLGLRVQTMLRLTLALATLVVAAVVSVSGLISFIGLLAPHIARLLLRRGRFLAVMALSGIVGALLLLCADTLARSLASGEIPISVLTSLLGAPFLIYLVRKGERVP